MCTAITLQTHTGQVLMGRTMDFSYPLSPRLFISPKNYTWKNLSGTHQFCSKYSFIGIGQDISPIAFADGVNEMGFSAAVLYFPGYASYDSLDTATGKIPIAAIELLQFLLSFSSSVTQAIAILRSISIIGVADSITHSIAPLHWLIADQTGSCMVIEKTANGLQAWTNPVGVLSNSPDFPWHMTNLRNYMNVAPRQAEESMWGSASLSPFGQGGGTFGLPGDYTPPSRFVRAAYHKSHAAIPDNDKEAVMACFHIMESVSIPKGSVITSRETPDYTQYTAFMNLSTKEYFFTTCQNSQITTAALDKNLCTTAQMVSLGALNRPVSFDVLTDSEVC